MSVDEEAERIIRQVQNIAPDFEITDWATAFEWNAKKVTYLLDEICRAKRAKKHILAADMSIVMFDLVEAFRDIVINSIPDYEYRSVMADRLRDMFDARIINPQDN